MAVVAWSQVELFEKRLSRCAGMAQLGEWLNSVLWWKFRELPLRGRNCLPKHLQAVRRETTRPRADSVPSWWRPSTGDDGEFGQPEFAKYSATTLAEAVDTTVAKSVVEAWPPRKEKHGVSAAVTAVDPTVAETVDDAQFLGSEEKYSASTAAAAVETTVAILLMKLSLQGLRSTVPRQPLQLSKQRSQFCC